MAGQEMATTNQAMATATDTATLTDTGDLSTTDLEMSLSKKWVPIK